MERRKKGYIYHAIGTTGKALTYVEQYSNDDNERYKIGNYLSPTEAREAEKEIQKIGFIKWLKRRFR